MINSQEMKKISRWHHNILLKCLNTLRSKYDYYNVDDKEVIDAINTIREELHFNVGIED